MTEHMYSESGAYAITASFWNADCGLITITTEFYVEGCGDVMPEGCYDDNGTFYLIGEELFVAECEFYFCEGGNNWSALQEIPGCGNDCEFEIVATQQDTQMVVIGYLRLHQRIRSQIFSGILEMENLVLRNHDRAYVFRKWSVRYYCFILER